MRRDPTIRSLRTDCKTQRCLDHRCVLVRRFQLRVVPEGDLLDPSDSRNGKVPNHPDHHIAPPSVDPLWAVPLATFYLKYQFSNSFYLLQNIKKRKQIDTSYAFTRPIIIIIMEFRILLTLTLLLVFTNSNPVIRIPLSYAFDWDLTTKLPIYISFNHSNIYSTRPTKHLFLLDHNVSAPVKNFPIHQSKDRVEIGLKFPSDFIASLSKTYGVSYEAVELQKQNYLSAVIFDDNYVESWDIWKDSTPYKVHVKYNFGDDLTIDNKPMSLIEGQIVYFEEYLIREVLNRMTKQNEINFRFIEQNRTVQLIGKVQNLPQLTFIKDDYIFKIKLGENTLHYIPAIQNKQRMTQVGYKALYLFNKIKFRKSGQIIFKRTSLVYQLYLFLIYFTCLFIFLMYLTKKSLNDSSQFVKHILRWVFFKDRVSKVEVLKSELE